MSPYPDLVVPERTALLIVDVQQGFMNEHTKHILPLLSKFLSESANDYAVVVATRFYNLEGSLFEEQMGWTDMRDTGEIQLVDFVAEHAVEVIDKPGYSAFYIDKNIENVTGEAARSLRALLEHHQIEHVHLVGVDTDACVFVNAAEAFDSGFKTAVLRFLCASTAGPETHEQALRILVRTIGRDHVI